MGFFGQRKTEAQLRAEVAALEQHRVHLREEAEARARVAALERRRYELRHPRLAAVEDRVGSAVTGFVHRGGASVKRAWNAPPAPGTPRPSLVKHGPQKRLY